MKIIKAFKNNELLTFIKNNTIKIYIDKNYDKLNLNKGYKMNLISTNKGSYKGSFMNNYICKKFRLNQKSNLTNIETNKILNYCKYFLLSINEYKNYLQHIKSNYYWFLRSSYYHDADDFAVVDASGNVNSGFNSLLSFGFVPFFLQERRLTNESHKNF